MLKNVVTACGIGSASRMNGHDRESNPILAQVQEVIAQVEEQSLSDEQVSMLLYFISKQKSKLCQENI